VIRKIIVLSLRKNKGLKSQDAKNIFFWYSRWYWERESLWKP
jgi:hypothetical protein